MSLALAGADADGDSLAYTAGGLPAGLSINAATGDISGTIADSAASTATYTVIVGVSDGTLQSNQTFSWTVSHTGITNPGAQYNASGDQVALQISATNTGGGAVTFTATGLPPGLSISSTGLISGTLTTSGDYSVTVTGNGGIDAATAGFVWSVAHLSLANPGNQTNRDGAAVSLAVSATDADGDPLTFAATGLPPGLSINSSTGDITGNLTLAAHSGSPYDVAISVSDGTSSISQAFLWTVTPRVALANPGGQANAAGDSVSLHIQASALAGGTLSYSSGGLPPGLGINSATGLLSGTVAASAAGAYSATVTASDGTASVTISFAWTVAAIVVPAPGGQVNLDGDSVSLSLAAQYHGAGLLTYSATSLPPGLSIDSATGLVSGTVAATADLNSPYTVTVTATDGVATASQSLDWTINPVVTLHAIGDQSNTGGDTVSLTVSATDARQNTLAYSATGLPPGLGINSGTGAISGTIASGAAGGSPYTVTVTASDGAVSASQTFQWTVGPLALVNPGPQSAVDDGTVALTLSAHDAAGNAITYAASGLPPGLGINAHTGTISGTVASIADAGSAYLVAVSASDGANQASADFKWTITKVGITSPGEQTNTEGDIVSLQLQASGIGGTLAYSASGLPDGLSIDTSTGLITGTIAAGAAAAGPFTVIVAVTNGTNAASAQFTWTVNPVVAINPIDDQSNNEGDSVSLQINASDCKNGNLVYTAAGLPDGLTINSTSGLISGTISGANSTCSVNVVVTDGVYTSSLAFYWETFNPNNQAPTLGNPGNQSSQIGDAIDLILNANDPDGDNLTYSSDSLPAGLSLDPNTGEITGVIADNALTTSSSGYPVTLTVADSQGATATQTFSWFITQAPLQAAISPIDALQGADPGDFVVASFSTPDMGANPCDFEVTDNWGGTAYRLKRPFKVAKELSLRKTRIRTSNRAATLRL